MDHNYLKTEYTLCDSNYDDCLKYNGLLALAFNIQRLLFIDPGTYPNHPDLGIGIRQYQFERLNTGTLTDIRDRIDDQIRKYILDDLDNISISSQVEKYNPNGNDKIVNSIAIKFDINKTINGSNDFVIVLNQSPVVSKKIASELYI